MTCVWTVKWDCVFLWFLQNSLCGIFVIWDIFLVHWYGKWDGGRFCGIMSVLVYSWLRLWCWWNGDVDEGMWVCTCFCVFYDLQYIVHTNRCRSLKGWKHGHQCTFQRENVHIKGLFSSGHEFSRFWSSITDMKQVICLRGCEVFMQLMFKPVNLRMIICEIEGIQEYLCNTNGECERWIEKEEIAWENKQNEEEMKPCLVKRNKSCELCNLKRKVWWNSHPRLALFALT